MRDLIGAVQAAGLLLFATGASASAPIDAFTHIVIIVQENRTPDNLFQGLCAAPGACSTTPGVNQYDIQVSDWLNKESPTGVTQPVAEPLSGTYDLSHAHQSFVNSCDLDVHTGVCRMDGAATIHCGPGSCPANPAYAYVDNSTGTVDP